MLRHLLRLAHRARMLLFVLRLRVHARLVGADLDLDVHPTARLRGRVDVFLGHGSRTSLTIGPGGLLERGVLLHLRGGTVDLGPSVTIRRGAVLRVRGGELRLQGDNMLSYGSVIHCDERVVLGRGTFTGEGVTIVDSNHVRPVDPAGSLYHSFETAPVRIGDGTWLGAKVTVTAGTTIGDDVVVAAHAVVVDDLPSGVTAAGVPARVVSTTASG